jgi:uncharacterized protein (DUF1800 family)
MTFGPRPGDIEVVRKMGLQNWIQAQLHPETITESPTLEEKLKPFATLGMNLTQSMENNAGVMMVIENDAVRFVNTRGSVLSVMSPSQTPEGHLKAGKIYRTIYSNRQLEEVLVDFWFNHFNVTATKSRPFVADYEREAIRPFVLGQFKDLLFAAELHPAMMLYLDNVESIAPEIAQPGPNMTVQLGKARGLNENFSRELMELHTLGVNGGYTQKDVEQAARTFTGWSLRQTAANTATKQPAKVEWLYYDWAHDPKDKVVLGQTIASEGVYEVRRLLTILAEHPSTAHHISFRLAQRFVSDEPPQSLIDRMAKRFIDTDGDLREVMTTLLTSDEFLAEDTWYRKLKSPLELAAGAVRALNGHVSATLGLEDWIARMGQPLYSKVEPTGYPNTGESWLNAATVLARMNFGTNLADGNVVGVDVDASQWRGKDTAAIAQGVLGRSPTAPTLEALKSGQNGTAARGTSSFIAGLSLGSPDFQRK